MTQLVVPTLNGHNFETNSVDKPVAESSPLGQTTQYSYDRDRRLTAITLPSGETISNHWQDGQLQSTTSPEGTVSYAYSCGGKASQITQGSEGIDYQYDGDLLTQQSSSGTANYQIGYAYNNDFALNRLSYGGATALLGYDNDGLLTDIS